MKIKMKNPNSQFSGRDKEGKCVYGLNEFPTDQKWSGHEVPKIGDKVKINFNGLGSGVVVCYFWEHGYAGVEVKLDKQPDWHAKQNGKGHNSLVFGAEIIKKCDKPNCAISYPHDHHENNLAVQ